MPTYILRRLGENLRGLWTGEGAVGRRLRELGAPRVRSSQCSALPGDGLPAQKS